MARIAGVDLPRDKRVEIGLTYIYGIGHTSARAAIVAAGVDPSTRVRDLDDAEIKGLRDFIDGNFKVEGDLRRDVAQNIKRKVEINCYQGIRHRRGLPVHAQRTHTNARTRKGPKRAVGGSGKVKKRKH